MITVVQPVSRFVNCNIDDYIERWSGRGIIISMFCSLQSDLVCRVPLYLKGGMARVRVRKTTILTLDEGQLQLAQRCHAILANLSMDISKPEDFDIHFEGERVSFLSGLDTPIQRRDPCSDLAMNPDEAQMCAMFIIARLPGKCGYFSAK